MPKRASYSARHLVRSHRKRTLKRSIVHSLQRLQYSTDLTRFSNGRPNTHPKRWTALLLISALIIGVFVIDQALKGHALFSAGTAQTIWEDDLSESGLTNWNCNALASKGAATTVIYTAANTTHTATCISKSSVDLSTTVARKAWFIFSMDVPNLGGSFPNEFGWFLTRNSTLPVKPGSYTPYNDRNVVLFMQGKDAGAGTVSYNLFVQRDADKTMAEADPLSCAPGGSAFICGSVAWGALPVAHQMWADLNLTGTSGTAGNSKSTIEVGATTGPTSFTVNSFVGLQVQSQPYYIGIFEGPRNPAPNKMGWDVLRIQRISPFASTPNLDSGGFFGPVIKALITIGIFIMQTLAKFFSGVADAFVTALDILGGFFGFGALGTQVRNLLTGLATFISNIFVTIFAQLLQIETFLNNGLTSVVVIVTTYWGVTTGFFAQLVSFFGIVWTVWGFMTFLFPVGVNAFQFFLIMDFALWVWMNLRGHGFSGTMQWYKMNRILWVDTIGRFMYWLFDESFDAAVRVKHLIAGWI